MDAEDFQALYKLVRGNRAAIAVTDARALFMEKKMVAAHEKLAYARETFVESRSRVIKQDVTKQVDPNAKDAERQIKKLKRKQEKVLEAIEKFDELMPALDRLVRREREKEARNTEEDARNAEVAEATSKNRLEDEESAPEAVLSDANSAPSPDSVTGQVTPEAPVDVLLKIARPSDISPQFAQAFARLDGEKQLDVIDRAFGFHEVRSENDLYGEALYYIRSGDRGYLVRTPETIDMGETVTPVNVVDDRPLKPFTRDAFLQMGVRRKMVLLTRREESGRAGEDWELSSTEGTWVEDTVHREPGDEDTDAG